MMLRALSRPTAGAVLALMGVGVLAAGLAVADDKAKPGQQPDKKATVFDKPAPEGVADLKALQAATKAVLKKNMPATVGLIIGQNAGSGVIVDEEGHILTAAHVSGEPNQTALIVFPDGTTAKGKTLGGQEGIDSGLVKITSKAPKGGKWPFVPKGDSSKLKKHQWVVAVGHPGGARKGRTPVVRLGRILETSAKHIRTDCPLVGGDSGGPLFDMDGKVVGIHSRINTEITANVHVPVNIYVKDWDRLVAGERWGGWLELFAFWKTDPAAVLGFEMDDELKVSRVVRGSNAAKAGLQVGDVVRALDGRRVSTRREAAALLVKLKSGEELSLTVRRDGESVKMSFRLGKKSSG